jgi:hypothetical protein
VWTAVACLVVLLLAFGGGATAIVVAMNWRGVQPGAEPRGPSLPALGVGVGRPSRENFLRIKPGMTEAQVIDLLGPPESAQPVDNRMKVNSWCFRPTGTQDYIQITIQDGVVIDGQYQRGADRIPNLGP